MTNENKISACYVINDDFDVVNYNDVAKETYPSLIRGKKCYACLMDADGPCGGCPVVNDIKGPKVYLDPIRHIYETVDAINLPLSDGSIGHALIFSTTGEREAVSRQLPTTEKELRALLNQHKYDRLTGDLSREGFIETVNALLESKKRTDYVVAVFDIYNFKAINEIFGIEGGDQLLRFVSEKIKSSVLSPEVSARLESDWFVFLIKRDCLKWDIFDDLLKMKYDYHGRTIHIQMRCGIYFVEDTYASASQMVEWAIMAKQNVERDSRRQYTFYQPQMSSSNTSEAQLLLDFTKSLKDHHFKVYYQPIISLHTGKIYAAEALVRWQHPERGLIPPDVFIDLFEKNGQISELDHYVLKQVYAFQKKRAEAKKPIIPVSVNLSWQDFYDDHLMDQIMTLKKQGDLPVGAVNFEVVETSMAALEQNANYLLEQIRESGSKLLLDDFGTGYSSFRILGNYPFNIIKIDRSFISQIETNLKIRSIVASIIQMAHSLHMEIVAEGVETKAQLRLLQKEGCDHIQGYYFSKPLPEDDYFTFLEAENTWPLSWEDNVLNSDQELSCMKDLLDHSGMFIQVCHPEDYTMVYANALTKTVSGHPEKPYKGEKCYEYMLGLEAPCGHCPMRKMGNENEKEMEVDDGEHVFHLTGRYANWGGKKVFIENGRDVTNTKNAERRYTNRVKDILANIPDGQGVFHVDLTTDTWMSSDGHAQNARDMQDMDNVDALIRQIGSFVPEPAGQEKFFNVFCRQALLDAYADGHFQVILETDSYYDDGKIRWSRIIANLIENPSNGHLECIIYGVDISDEKIRLEELQLKEKQAMLEEEVNEVRELYNQADRDRRVDFLTGLYNRLDLFELIQKSLTGKFASIETMYMLDIDNFKHINDTYGHSTGDLCLKELGGLLKRFGEQHHICFYRYGGEEFLGIGLDQSNPQALAAELLTKIDALTVPLAPQSSVSFTVSIGYTTNNRRYEKMIDLADQAMYLAKKQGKNRVVGH